MTPEEADDEALREAYDEALRRIREAEEIGALELDLSGRKEGKTDAMEYSGLETLNQLPRELERLTSLQSLDLSFCHQLSGDLLPLASNRLTSPRAGSSAAISPRWQPNAL